MSPRYRLAAIGECMIELAPLDAETYRRNFAGDTLNMAVYFARVSDSSLLPISYITALGDDPFSDAMLTSWEQEGIQISLVRKMPGRLPGLYLIRNDEAGERFFYFYRSQSPAREMFTGEAGDRLTNALLDFDILYFSGITLGMLHEEGRDKFLQLIKKAHQRGIQIVFDTNFRATLWPDLAKARYVIQQVQQYTTIALPSFVDEQVLFNDKNPEKTAARLHELGAREVIVKLGGAGYLLSTDEGYHPISVAPVAAIVDTTGAGDSFNGVYLALRLQGREPLDAAKRAAEIAATVIMHRGAIIPKKAMPRF